MDSSILRLRNVHYCKLACQLKIKKQNGKQCRLMGRLVWVVVLWPSQQIRVMSSAVSLPNHTFPGEAQTSKQLKSICAHSAGLCLPPGISLVVSSPSPVTSQGQGHSLMMLLSANGNCHSKRKEFFRLMRYSILMNLFSSDLFTILYLCVPGLAWAI